MSQAFELSGVAKRFGTRVALEAVSVVVPRRSIVGLIGRNGSGKSTLMRLVAGLYLPDAGECTTLGRRTAELGAGELSRLGLVEQHASLIPWMQAGQLLRYVSSFYPAWDSQLERRLIAELEVDPTERVSGMSPGNRQKLALVAATCHHPSLLLLDEPLSDLDPIARQSVLLMLLDRFSSHEMTIVISSHMLHDIEPVVNRIVCLDDGMVAADDDIDSLRERHEEWIVASPAGRLPARYSEPYVLAAQGDGYRARLLVRDVGAGEAVAFRAVHDATVEVRPLNLERIFPYLRRDRRSDSARRQPEPAA
ncbi:hypothetical protein BH23GEM9_BH23GEM9_05100 [soil metagenome]